MIRRRNTLLVIGALTLISAMGCATDDNDGDPFELDSITSSASLTNDELALQLADVTGCGSPLTRETFAGDDSGIHMYLCGFNRGFIYLTDTPSAMDAFLTSVRAPCDRRMDHVRGDRWYFATGDDSLAERLVGEGGESVDCGAEQAPTEVCETAPSAPTSVQEAERAAMAAVGQYLRTIGDLMRDARLPIETLGEVAVGRLLEGDLYIYGGARDFGTREAGRRAKFRQPTVIRTDLANTDVAVAGACPYVVVEGCRDTTQTKERNINGEEASLPFISGTSSEQFTVVLTQDGWRVFERELVRATKLCPNRVN